MHVWCALGWQPRGSPEAAMPPHRYVAIYGVHRRMSRNVSIVYTSQTPGACYIDATGDASSALWFWLHTCITIADVSNSFDSKQCCSIDFPTRTCIVRSTLNAPVESTFYRRSLEMSMSSNSQFSGDVKWPCSYIFPSSSPNSRYSYSFNICRYACSWL